MHRLRPLVAIIVSATVLALAYVAAAVGKPPKFFKPPKGTSYYLAGTFGKGPFEFAIVRHHNVGNFRWSILDSCTTGKHYVGAVDPQVKTPIDSKGNFSVIVTYKNGGMTRFSGTISGKKATLTIEDNEPVQGAGACSGSHTFNAHKITKFKNH